MLLIMYWKMYWGLWTGFCIGKCIAGWLAACFRLAFFFFHFISSPISCHFPAGEEMDQYLNVDHWEKKSEVSKGIT